MFRRLKALLAQMHGSSTQIPPESIGTSSAAVPEPRQERAVSLEEFTLESLWDDYERRTWYYDNARATLEKSNPRLLNWIGSIDYSGYTREKSLRALIASAEVGDENRILLRLEDWVPQVQRLARGWVLAHFRSLPLDSISSNQRLILYLCLLYTSPSPRD